MAGNTHLDALVAEMLGDIGKLHDEIRSLKDEALPALVTEAEEKLSGTVGKLLLAAQHFEKAVIELTQKRVEAAKAEIAASAVQAKNEAIGDVRQAVREAVAQPLGQLVGQLDGAVGEANGQQGRTLKHAVIAAVIGGVVAGAIVLGSGYFLMKDAAPAAAQQGEESAPAKPIRKGSKNG